MKIYLVTGNKKKAEYFKRNIQNKNITINHINIHLDEIQTLQLEEVVKHKVISAYDKIKYPVIVEDVSLEIKAIGRLPGTFIKFFLQELSLEEIYKLTINKTDEAIAKCSIAYYDGKNIKIFTGEVKGRITYPKGERGFGNKGWDSIFIPEGYDKSRAELTEEEYNIEYLKLRRIDLLDEYLKNINK